MTPKRWKEKFNAIGIMPSGGKYSVGTFANSDIAFDFASWLSPEFKNVIVPTLMEKQKRFIYADEAEILNVALF